MVAALPCWALQKVSLLIRFFLYHILHYRKDVIRLNLSYALPYLEQEEYRKVEKNFYTHLSELIVEVIKGLFIPIQELMSRITLTEESKALLNRFTQENRHVVLMLGHYGNWEWPLLIMQQYTSLRHFALYSPLSSKPLDEFIKKRRERFGAVMLDATKARNLMSTLRAQPSVLAVVGDQSPTGRAKVHQTNFLSLDTNFFTGGEKIAQKLQAAVVYVHLKKIDFARYEIHLVLISEQADREQEGQITEQYVRILEEKILQQPEFWLWSHKRWKNILPY